jgi:hypothetical protein
VVSAYVGQWTLSEMLGSVLDIQVAEQCLCNLNRCSYAGY